VKLFVVIGMHRSGHHGVLNWICEQHGCITHLNNVRLSKDKKSFETPRPDICVTQYGENPYDLLVNLETFDLRRWKDQGWDKSGAVQRADEIQMILVLRRFRNWLASTAVHPGNKCLAGDVGQDAVEDWCVRRFYPYRSHLTAALGYSPIPDLLVIRFDHWFAFPEYRREIAEQLEIPFTDAGLNVVPRFASGSTFDRRKFDGKAQEMKVLERWKQAEGTEPYEKLMKIDPGLDQLSEQYFNASLAQYQSHDPDASSVCDPAATE
jgi:hypothetical protein